MHTVGAQLMFVDDAPHCGEALTPQPTGDQKTLLPSQAALVPVITSSSCVGVRAGGGACFQL